MVDEAWDESEGMMTVTSGSLLGVRDGLSWLKEASDGTTGVEGRGLRGRVNSRLHVCEIRWCQFQHVINAPRKHRCPNFASEDVNPGQAESRAPCLRHLVRNESHLLP